MNNLKAKQSLEELEVLFDYLSVINLLDYCRFDLSLSRGLDYYTGLTYEAVLTDYWKIGSICGGGRYDNLIGIIFIKTNSCSWCFDWNWKYIYYTRRKI